MKKLRSRRPFNQACVVFAFCVATAILPKAQTFTTLTNFDGSNGATPWYGSLVQGFDGDLYGTTFQGGAYSAGTIFKVTTTGTLTTLYSFCSQVSCTDGRGPIAGLVQGTKGNFYGTTAGGGANGHGTVFEMTPAGKLTTLHSFDGTDGDSPSASLVQATNGNFFGTTYQGGANFGTVFEITPAGELTTLHTFCPQPGCPDGGDPLGALMQATNGNLYGTTTFGGSVSYGTIFEITASGKLTTIHNFTSYDGGAPYGGLIQATDHNFYGTTYQGGDHSAGTVFKVSPRGTLTTLHSFYNSDGDSPYAGLVQGTDGNFYGTTAGGGANGNWGTVFEITATGTLTTLHSFDSTDGQFLPGGLIQATDGKFYGMTNGGGANGDGTIFSLSVGLGPFVETSPTSGKVDAAVVILGNNLTGSTSVTFNGTKAPFTVNSTGTAIKTTVPSGVTTGKVKVTTPIRTLTSNVNFRVTPTISSFSPTSGPPGTSVVINGESFTGATSVTFGGVKATSFTVDSYTKITATVPTGAKTGKITVTTPAGTETSTETFTVT